MFLNLSVILFTGGSGRQPPLPGADTLLDQTHRLPEQTPLEQTPPGADTPLTQCMLGDTGNKRAVRILLECILVIFRSHLRFRLV